MQYRLCSEIQFCFIYLKLRAVQAFNLWENIYLKICDLIINVIHHFADITNIAVKCVSIKSYNVKMVKKIKWNSPFISSFGQKVSQRDVRKMRLIMCKHRKHIIFSLIELTGMLCSLQDWYYDPTPLSLSRSKPVR